jgi:hypothetical protein
LCSVSRALQTFSIKEWAGQSSKIKTLKQLQAVSFLGLLTYTSFSVALVNSLGVVVMMIEITALAVLVTTIMSTLLSHGFEVLVALITRMPERVGACASSIISLLDVFDDGKQHSMKIYRSWIEHLLT